MNTRTALGTCLVLTAILAGAVFLDHAQRLVPVYAAARDLPAGTALHHGDLVVVRVRLPTTALRHYLQPTPGQSVAGRVLAAPVRQETLVPAELLLASNDAADQVELPVQADPGDMAQGLRPGDRVQVLAAYTEGARRGDATVLLPAAEVVRVLEDPGNRVRTVEGSEIIAVATARGRTPTGYGWRPRALPPSRPAPVVVVVVVRTAPAAGSRARPAVSRLSPWWSWLSRAASTGPRSAGVIAGPVSFRELEPQPKV
jgi:hypothetical protein